MSEKNLLTPHPETARVADSSKVTMILRVILFIMIPLSDRVDACFEATCFETAMSSGQASMWRRYSRRCSWHGDAAIRNGIAYADGRIFHAVVASIKDTPWETGSSSGEWRAPEGREG